ncbi:hypothetical protein [Roseobacter litoralis]|nr:hypothetical protein [Roseobacter litoralis]
MAKARQTSAIFGAVTGAVLSAAAVLSPTASFAQEATPVAQPFDESLWTQETWELKKAREAAGLHVKSAENTVAILFHVGDDLRARAQAAAEKHNVSAEHALQVMLNHIAEDYTQKFDSHGLEARMFSSTNLDSRASGLTYILRIRGSDNEIGSISYEDESGNPLLNLAEANTEIERVARAVAYLNQQASLDTGEPVPNFGG